MAKELIRWLLAWFGVKPLHVFVSYRRRGDGAGYGGEIARQLRAHFGPEACYFDVEKLNPGEDFVVAIARAVQKAHVLIVVVGRDWLTQTNADGRRRLEDPHDFVRYELKLALERGGLVIPVLVGGALMPTAEQLPRELEAFARRQAHEISDTRWDYDLGRLLTTLESAGIPKRAKLSQRWRTRVFYTGGIAAGALAVGLTATLTWRMLHDVEPAPSAHRDGPPPLPPVPPVKGDLAADSLLDALKNELEASRSERMREQQEREAAQRSARQTRTVARSETSAADLLGQGQWNVSYSDSSGTYRGIMQLNGSVGALRMFANTGAGMIAIDQGIVAGREGSFTTLQGSNPVDAATGLPVTFYAPDHFHLQRGAGGEILANNCDIQHQCFPAAFVRAEAEQAN